MLVRGRRTPDRTEVRRDASLALRRALVGAALLGVAGAVGGGVGGWAWLASAVLAIPAAFTLASVRRPYTAPCPGCGALLGGRLVQLPDEPVLGTHVHDLRCHDCGIYVDASTGVVREVPFQRVLASPGYECTLDAARLGDLAWPSACVACGAAGVRSLKLSTREAGVSSAHEATLGTSLDGHGPSYCAAHGGGDDPVARAVMVARTPARVTVQFSLYAAYRSFLDGNRDALDVIVRSSAVGDAPAPDAAIAGRAAPGD